MDQEKSKSSFFRKKGLRSSTLISAGTYKGYMNIVIIPTLYITVKDYK